MYGNLSTVQIWADTNLSTLPTVDLSNDSSKVVTRNELSYGSSPSRSNDMSLVNDQEAYYVPTIEVTVNYLEAETYSRLSQIINSRGFIVYYQDQELGEMVYRSMYATEQSVSDLAHSKATMDGALGVTLKFVSRYGYPYTRRGSANYNFENKYHMYELYAHRTSSDFLPMGHTIQEEDYV